MTVTRLLEWAALVWLLTWLAVPLMIIGQWIADRLDRVAERWCRA